jgi:hypothetical protein
MKKVILFCTVVIVSMLSCTKDGTPGPSSESEVATDTRDQIVGVYSATTEVSSDEGNSTTTSMLTISKDPLNSKGLLVHDVDQDDNYIAYNYKLMVVAQDSNGLIFNVPSQQVYLAKGLYTEWVGTAKYLLDGNKFDGGFLTSTKTLNYGFSGNKLVDGIVVPFTGQVTAVKTN